MKMGDRLVRYGGVKLSQRINRSIPVLGTLIAVATVGVAMRRKGVLSGTLDTGLNAVPLVGTLKNIVEIVRGKDFFPDRSQDPRRASAARRAARATGATTGARSNSWSPQQDG